jgi:hypothetical protein
VTAINEMEKIISFGLFRNTVSEIMKMLLIILLFGAVCCSSTKPTSAGLQKIYIIEPGKGTNQLLIGKTKITSAFTLLGKNDSLSRKIIDGIDSSFVVYYYVYNKLGLTIISPSIVEHKGEDLNNSYIQSIYFTSPAKVKTTNGIVLNKSTLEEVLRSFDKPDDQDRYADVTILHYRKRGISFIIEKELNIVTGIEVYEENGYSNHL